MPKQENSKLHKTYITKIFTRLQKKSAGFGLIEVLVAIAISAIILIGAIEVSANGIRLIKQNELKDISGGILVRSLEISRSPVNFNLTSQMSGVNEKYFKLEQNPQGQFELTETTGTSEITECRENSTYRIENIDVEVPMCNQIQVRVASQDPDKGSTSYRIKSIVAYKFIGEDYTDELISYRTEFAN